MANNIKGKVWSLDTAVGVVTTDPVTIHAVQVRFTTAGAGSFQMLTNISAYDNSVGNPLIDVTSVATSTANAFQLTQIIPLGDQTFYGLKKVLSVNVDTIYVITGVSK